MDNPDEDQQGRARRRLVLDRKRCEIEALREEVKSLRLENEALRGAQTENLRGAQSENLSGAQSEKIEKLEREKEDYKTLVVALKNVNVVAKQMIQLREAQIKELGAKLDDIEKLIPRERENANMRREYERQLVNIRNLKILYEEKQRAEKREKEAMQANIEALREELRAEAQKNTELALRISELERKESNNYDELRRLESSLGLARADSRQHEAELSAINRLFSDVLSTDLDRLNEHLGRHRELLASIASSSERECSGNASAMPKALLDLILRLENEKMSSENRPEPLSETRSEAHEQLEIEQGDTSSETPSEHLLRLNEKKRDDGTTTSETHSEHLLRLNENKHDEDTTASETPPRLDDLRTGSETRRDDIIHKLPKVWKVLIELLSHQRDDSEDSESMIEPSSCYKTVQGPKGPDLVLSVSKTFIRLKELIMEKKALTNEMTRMKELNCHLEKRLTEQESKLSSVQSEVSKTWHLVGKIQKQHRLLHTQEKVLRYELAQKRHLLVELREQLESGREKSAQARIKNDDSAARWRQLREEFASRKVNATRETEEESGFSDEGDDTE